MTTRALDENSLDAIRRAATCPACCRLYREPRMLEPCGHSVCLRCLSGGGHGTRVNNRASAAGQSCCPECGETCTGHAPYRSMSALATLISNLPDAVLATTLTAAPRRSRFSLAGAAAAMRHRPSAVLHFSGPPHNLRRWPAAAGGRSGGGGGGGVAAILRDANNQQVWAAVPATDGVSARPVFQPSLDEPYTISGFCLVRVDGEWTVVLSDFYRNCLVVCDLDGQCLQRLIEVPRPSVLCADEASGAVIAIADNGVELRAFEWRKRRLRQRGPGFRHPRLRYARAIAAGAGRVCVADSAAKFVFVVDLRRIMDGEATDGDSGAGVGGFACEETPPIAVAVAAYDDGSGGGCVFVNSVGANRRCCVDAHDLSSGRRVLELSCGFVCSCGCHNCVDTGNDPDVGALSFDADRLELMVARRARMRHALVFRLAADQG